MPFSPVSHGGAVAAHDGRVDARQGQGRRPRLDRQQAQPVGVAEDRTARLGLPHVVDDRDPPPQDGVLQPLPRRRVEHFAGREDALDPGVVDAGEGAVAVAHQSPDGGGRREDAGGPDLLHHRPPRAVRLGVVEGPLEHHRRAADEQGRVHHVAVAHDPADVRRRPPDVVGPQAEAPAGHARDVHLIAAVGVDRELGLGGGPRRGEDERGLVRLHRDPVARVAGPSREEVAPRHLRRRVEGRRRVGALQHHDPLHRVPRSAQRVVDDRLQRHVPALPVGDIGCEHDA